MTVAEHTVASAPPRPTATRARRDPAAPPPSDVIADATVASEPGDGTVASEPARSGGVQGDAGGAAAKPPGPRSAETIAASKPKRREGSRIPGTPAVLLGLVTLVVPVVARRGDHVRRRGSSSSTTASTGADDNDEGAAAGCRLGGASRRSPGRP